MKVSYKFLVPAFLAGLLLAGCGQQDTAMPEEAMEAAGEMASDAADAAAEAVSGEPGGYVPTDEERVPGETRP